MKRGKGAEQSIFDNLKGIEIFRPLVKDTNPFGCRLLAIARGQAPHFVQQQIPLQSLSLPLFLQMLWSLLRPQRKLRASQRIQVPLVCFAKANAVLMLIRIPHSAQIA